MQPPSAPVCAPTDTHTHINIYGRHSPSRGKKQPNVMAVWWAFLTEHFYMKQFSDGKILTFHFSKPTEMFISL